MQAIIRGTRVLMPFPSNTNTDQRAQMFTAAVLHLQISILMSGVQLWRRLFFYKFIFFMPFSTGCYCGGLSL